MALDGIFLHHIKNEIKNEALYARVSQIYQPNREPMTEAKSFCCRPGQIHRELIFVLKLPKIPLSRQCSVCYSENA